MVFPSLPLYLDPPNWNQQQTHPPADDDVIRHHLPPPPASDNGDGPVRPGSMAERARLAKIPQPEASLRCPRCDSSNTKFCYFNNYSLSQPRHFCKTCRRYWTRGGALRSVPVGGGCRRNKRSSKLCTTPTSSSYKPQVGAAMPSSSTGTSAVPAASGSMNLLFPMTSMAPLSFSAPWQQQQDYGLEQWRIEQMQQTALMPPATYWGGIEASTPAGMYNLNTEVEGGGLGLGFGGSISHGRQFRNVGSSGGGGGGNGNGGGWMSTADI